MSVKANVRVKNFIIIKMSVHQEYKQSQHECTKNRPAKHVKQKLIKLQGETDKSMITVKRLQLSTLKNQTANQQGEKNSTPLTNGI